MSNFLSQENEYYELIQKLNQCLEIGTISERELNTIKRSLELDYSNKYKEKNPIHLLKDELQVLEGMSNLNVGNQSSKVSAFGLFDEPAAVSVFDSPAIYAFGSNQPSKVSAFELFDESSVFVSSVAKPEATKSFKVVLNGAGGVGKSSIIRSMLKQEFDIKYIPTLGVSVHDITFKTNKGNIKLSIWDVAGQEKFGGLRDGYYIGAQAAILVYDMSSSLTFNLLRNISSDITRVTGQVPMVVCGCKSDIEESASIVGEQRVTKFLADKPYYSKSIHYVSAKLNNVEAPFMDLLKSLLGDDTVAVE